MVPWSLSWHAARFLGMLLAFLARKLWLGQVDGDDRALDIPVYCSASQELQDKHNGTEPPVGTSWSIYSADLVE